MPSKAQIVVTIGPATKGKEIIKEMIKHQMDAVRLNFSWGRTKNMPDISKMSGMMRKKPEKEFQLSKIYQAREFRKKLAMNLIRRRGK